MRDLIYGELMLDGSGQFSSFPFAGEQSTNINDFAFGDRLKFQVQRVPRRTDQGVHISIDENAHLVVGFVGEVHNYTELVAEVQDECRDASDADLVLSLYKKYGLGLASRINGLFSLVVFDWKQDKLVLLQDRFSSPDSLFWTIHAGRLTFSTDVRLVARHSDLPADVDVLALKYFLAFSFVPNERTLFAGIRKLRPEQALICKAGKVSVQRIRFPRLKGRKFRRDPDELVSDYLSLMRRSVERRVKDTNGEIGFALSAGYDTNLNLLLAADYMRGPIHVFCVGTNEAHHEIHRQREIVRRLHPYASRHEYMIAGREILYLPEIIHKYGVPFAEPGILLAYFLAKMAREYVDVVIGGEIADQVFYVEPRGTWIGKVRRWAKEQALGMSFLAPLMERRKARREARNSSVAPHYYTTIGFTGNELDTVLKAKLPRLVTEEKNIYATVTRYNLLKKTMHRFFSMGARFPYVDTEVRHFVQQLPYKLRRGKLLHKMAVRSLIPPDTWDLLEKRPGATATTHQFEDPVLREQLFAYLRESDVLARFFDMHGVATLLNEYHTAEGRELQIITNKLFSLLCFDTWYRIFILGEPPDEISYGPCAPAEQPAPESS